MLIKDLFASSDAKNSLGSKFRAKRFEDFKAKLDSIPTPVKILDIGGLESFWVNNGIGGDMRYDVTILNLDKAQVHYPNFKSLAGDATNLSAFEDKSFDIVFSNSVIEHVYTLENQQKMANEIMRVGNHYYVQTPNKHFFIEPHYILPFFDYLPNGLKYFILTRTPLSRGKRWRKEDAQQYIQEIRLIALGEMKKLFPRSKIYKEKFFGMVKSFTSHNFSA